MTSFRTRSFVERTFARQLLMQRWQATSYRQGWRFQADWLLPEVRVVATYLATRSSVPGPIARSLGAARARNGVSIGETMLDFRALFAAVDRNLDADALQSLVEGWTEETQAALPISCTDVYTGLATQAHFQRRVHELTVFGPDPCCPHVLTIISLPKSRAGAGHSWTHLARLGETVLYQLRRTGALAMYMNCAVHVLLPLNESNLARLMECKMAIEILAEGAFSPVRVNFHPLVPAAQEPTTPCHIPETS